MVDWWFIAGKLLGVATAVYLLIHGSHGARGSLAWVLSLLLLPWLAVPLYWSSGQLRYRAYRESVEQTRQRFSDPVQAINASDLSDSADTIDPILNRFGAIETLSGNSLELHSDSEAAYASMLDAIDSAERYVLMQSYIFRSDAIGSKVIGRLIDACKRGCRVALLYDEVGSWKLDQQLLSALEDAGGFYSGFTISKRLLSRLRINFRNHRKVLIIDGKCAFVGGLNIGQEYVDGGADFREWRDTHLEITGPAALAAQLSFCEDWLFSAAADKEKTAVCDDLNWEANRNSSGQDCSTVKLCPTGPHDTFLSGDLLFSQLIAQVGRRLWIASPYFIPDERVINLIKLAGLRGLDVRIMIPEKSDYRLIDYAHQAFIADLLPYGIQFYRFQPGFTHQKVILIDDLLSSVGSANADNRSFRLNFEISCLIWSTSFCATVEKMLEEDFSRCRKSTNAEDVPSARLETLKANAARMLAPAL